MKKTLKMIRHNKFLIFLCLFLFNILSCGIDTITVIGEPEQNVHTPVYSNAFDESFFIFTTNEVSKNSDDIDNSNLDGCKFLGTEIYYRIYSSYSTMTSETSTLCSLASSDTSSATAADKLIENYKYVPLKVTNQTNSTLIPTDKTDPQNRNIYIRLSDYQDLYDFSARILVGGASGTNLTGTDQVNKPVRNISEEELTFNFGRTSDNPDLNKVPLSGDEDVKYTTVSESGKWYVALFAVGVGRDVTYARIYSNILYLGCVTIDANSYDN